MTRGNWEAIFTYIPYFDGRPTTAWGGGEKADNGVITMPFPKYDAAVYAFIETFYAWLFPSGT